MTERAALIEHFLAANGWAGASRRPLAADASFRRYERVMAGERRAVLMDAPPPQEDVRPFAAVQRLLAGLGLSAPAILAAHLDHGFLLLEDFGDGTYAQLLETGTSEEALYALAVDVLIALHQRFDPAEAALLPPYDERRLLNEAVLFIDWYLAAVVNAEAARDLRPSYLNVWRGVLPVAEGAPRTLVLRDYHVDNLMRLEDRDGIAACGLLDFQDAVLGPSSYDLVSLLEDARRDIAPDLQERMIERYLAAFGALDREAFLASYAVLGAQRSCKILGIFTRLCRRDGKLQYLRHIPRLWRILAADFRHPALAPVADWFAAQVPAEWRRVPEGPCA